MNAFFNYFYNFMKYIMGYLWAIIIAIKDAFIGVFDISYYIRLFDSYKDDLSTGGWIAAIITHIILVIIFILCVFLIIRGIRVLLRFKVPVIEYERMKDEIITLKREVLKANYEKDKILAMKVSDLGMEVNPDLLDLNSDSEENDNKNSSLDNYNNDKKNLNNGEYADKSVNDKESDKRDNNENSDTNNNNDIDNNSNDKSADNVKKGEIRFPRLNYVDEVYLAQDYIVPQFTNNYTLEELCINFRNYASSKLGLFYELEVIKQVFASLGATRMLILQGISGTGKTSLPYAIGQYIMNPSLICAVQPSWRDRTELFGYYNEFTKKYSETDFLKTLYEAHYQQDIRLIILDEMNIARVEYYFAEMLSILELPREEERFVSIVASKSENDPEKMKDGKVWLPNNVWYVGTINNDDSTFAVADKVYDRAIPIDLDDKAQVFDAPDTMPMRINYEYLNHLYDEAKEKYPISEEAIMELEKLDQYLIDHFRLTFGNRILRQIKEFVPCYVACGGTEIDGIDFMFAKKILRKFESLGLGFIRDELDGLVMYIDHVYGKENMRISRAYLLRLKKISGAG